MSQNVIYCFKGVADGDSATYEFDANTMLSNVRSTLTANGFMPATVTNPNGVVTTQWQFIAGKAKHTNLKDALIAPSAEPYIPLKAILGGNDNRLIITDSIATHDPDLIGIGTEWFFNKYVSVQVSLNNYDSKARAQNTKVGAFPPMQLTNVVPTSTKITGIYDNVCVCVEGSVVDITINSWGAAGFQFAAGSEAGHQVIPASGDNTLYQAWPNNMNRYVSTTIRRYSDVKQTIEIVGEDSVGIGKNQEIQYQKFTVKTRRLTSFSQNGHTYSSNNQPPPLIAPSSDGTSLAETNGKPTDQQLANAETGLEVVPGHSIKPGTPTEGPASDQNWGAPISDLELDSWDQALGEVVIYFFVFKSHQDAVRVINGYNAPNPQIWS